MEVISENNNKPRYAGFWLRFLAYLIDRFVISIASFILMVPVILGIIAMAVNLDGITDPLEILSDGNWQNVGGILGLIILAILFNLVMQWLYYALMESSKYGGTLGKLALSIRVTDMEGNRVTFARATGRYFSRIITNMTMLIGYIIAGFTEKKQALHDLISSCLVIQK